MKDRRQPASERASAQREAQSEPNRGREARRPGEIPRKGWWDVAVRVKNSMTKDHLSLVAAGVALYAFLAIFPALAAMVSIYGLVTDPADLQRHMQSIEGVMPSGAAGIVNSELERIAKGQSSQLGWGLVAGLLIALWSASKGMKGMFEGLNVAYGEDESRGFFKLNATAVLLTLGAILFVLLFLALIVGVPALLATIQMGSVAQQAINYLRWPLLALCAIFALAVLYRYGPSRQTVQWKWVSWGAVVATVIWLAGSLLFSFYVSNFGNYNATYGSIGVIVILITWFLLGAYAVLLGAEINAEMEHQTAEDTTTEEAEPMGKRGARVADTLGETSGGGRKRA